jgi:CRISPR-associated endonuclease Csy4
MIEKKYIDMRLMSDEETKLNQVIEILFVCLHRLLVEMKSDSVAVVFPDYRADLGHVGGRIRLIGPANKLEAISESLLGFGIKDNIKLSPIAEIPNGAKHRTFSRVQVKCNPERVRRRRMKRHGISAEEALIAIPDSMAKTNNYPFIQVKSSSTGQSFQMYFRVSEELSPVDGVFNSYGLSSTATVPWF